MLDRTPTPAQEAHGHEPPEEDHSEARRDRIVDDYRAILAELSLLTTVSVLLFGFLLTSPPTDPPPLEEALYAAATVLVASATMVFVLPVAYHHLQFPFSDFDKFQVRSHRWVQMGLPLLGAGLYLSLVLAIWPIFKGVALIIAALPILAAMLIFALRKWQL